MLVRARACAGSHGCICRSVWRLVFEYFDYSAFCFFFCSFTHSFIHLHCAAVTLIAENKSSIVRYCTNNKIRSSFRFISNDQIRWASSGRRLKLCIYIVFCGQLVGQWGQQQQHQRWRQRRVEPLHKMNVPTGVLLKTFCLRK